MVVVTLSIKLQAQIVKKTNASIIEINYLKRSHKQKIAAWSFLTGGVFLIVISSVMRNTYIRNGNYYSNQFLPNTMTIAGGLSMVGSIPLFISSAKNKGRAIGTSVGISMQSIMGYSERLFFQNSYPIVFLK